MTYFYVCDKCGSLANITDEPLPDDGTWACDRCGCAALWQFDELAKAIQHSHDIYERKPSV